MSGPSTRCWYVRLEEVRGLLDFPTRRAAVAHLRRRFEDPRGNIRLERVGNGAYIYHGPVRSTTTPRRLAFVFTETGAATFHYDLNPKLPFDIPETGVAHT